MVNKVLRRIVKEYIHLTARVLTGDYHEQQYSMNGTNYVLQPGSQARYSCCVVGSQVPCLHPGDQAVIPWGCARINASWSCMHTSCCIQ